MDRTHSDYSRRRSRGFVHVLLLVMFMFGVVVYGVLESQTTLLSLKSNEPTQTRAALNQAREGLLEFASREEIPAQRDFADTHPPYIYYNIYSSDTLYQAAGDIDDVSTADNAMSVSFRYAANDRFVVWRPGQLPCPDVLGSFDATDFSALRRLGDTHFALWASDYDFDGLADYDDTFCSNLQAGISMENRVGVLDGSRAGRLPWREYFDNIAYSRGVGIGDLRDSNNDRLWYVVAPAAVDVRRPLSPYRIIRDDDGWLSFRFKDSSTLDSAKAIDDVLVDRVAAAVISPGQVERGESRRSEDEWFRLGIDFPVTVRAGAEHLRTRPDRYLEGNLATASLSLDSEITIRVSHEPHADTYELLRADELLDAFSAADSGSRMSSIADSLGGFEQRFGYLPAPATFDRENSEFISRRLGRSATVNINLSGPYMATPALQAVAGQLQGAAVLYSTRSVVPSGIGFSVRNLKSAFDSAGDQAVVNVFNAPKVKLTPHAVSRAQIGTEQVSFSYAPPFGELHLDSSAPDFLSVDMFNIVIPPHTPLVAAAPYLAFSRSAYEHWPLAANPNFSHVSGSDSRSDAGGSAVFADLAPANTGELASRGYAFKFNEGSLLQADISLTLAAEDAYFQLAGATGVTIDGSQEFRPVADASVRLQAGLATDAKSSEVFLMPPERTPLVAGNQGLLPAPLLPGQATDVLLEEPGSEQLLSNERGFMEPYYHAYTSADTDVGSTDGMLIVGSGGAVGQFPARVTMRGYETAINQGANVIGGSTNFAGIMGSQLDAVQPRVRAYAFDSTRPPSELQVHGLIEIPAGSKFIYPPGYMFALGKSSFIHTSGIPRPDGEPNTGILRSPLQFDYSDYENGAFVHLAPNAVLHDAQVFMGDILPDGSVASADAVVTLTLASGGLMRYTQLLHHTPSFGDSLLPRTQQQAAFRVHMEVEHQTLPPLVASAAAGSLAETLEKDRDWHLVYPYHGLAIPKSQRMHPRLTVNFADGSLGSATAITSVIRNVLGRAQMEYQARARRRPATLMPVAVISDAYPLLEDEIVLNPAADRGNLRDVSLAGHAYARTDFAGMGAELSGESGTVSPTPVLSGLMDKSFDLNSGMKMAVNPSELWFGVAPVSVSYSEPSSVIIDVVTTLTTFQNPPSVSVTVLQTAQYSNINAIPINQIRNFDYYPIPYPVRNFLISYSTTVAVPGMTTMDIVSTATLTHPPYTPINVNIAPNIELDNPGTTETVADYTIPIPTHSNVPDLTLNLTIAAMTTITIDVVTAYFVDSLTIRTPMTVATPFPTIVATTLTIDSAFMQARMRGEPYVKTPFVAPVGKVADQAPLGMVDGAAPDVAFPFTEHAMLVSRMTDIVGNTQAYAASTPPDDQLPLFVGFADADAIALPEVVTTVGATPTSLPVFLRRGEPIGAANYGMIELDTDAVMRTEDSSTSAVESQVLPSGTRVIFDTEVEVGDAMNVEAVAVVMTTALPPGVLGGVITPRSAGLVPLGRLTRVTVASKKVERLVPYARVGRGSGYYPIPESADVMLYGDSEAILTGFPQVVTMYAVTGFNDVLAATSIPYSGSVQTLILTNPRIIMPAGSRVPRVWRQGLPLPIINGFDPVSHVVVIDANGIRTTMADVSSPPVGVATVEVTHDYHSGYHEVFSIAAGTEIVADRIEMVDGGSFGILVNNPADHSSLWVDAMPSPLTTDIGLTRIVVPEDSGFDIPLETAGVPNLLVVASEGGVLVQDYDVGGTTHTVALGRVLPGQVIRSRSGGPGGLSRVELDFGSIDGDIEYEEFSARDLIFSQNNPLFYAIADECRDLHAQHDRRGAEMHDCADGAGEGLVVDVLPDEEIVLPEETVAPPNLVIASRDPHGTAVPVEVRYAASTISVAMLQLREDGQLRPLTATPDDFNLPGYHLEVITGTGTPSDPLSIPPGTDITLFTSSPDGFEFYMAEDELRGIDMTVTVFHDRDRTAVGDTRQQIAMVAGGFTKGYEYLPAHRVLAETAGELTLGIDSMIANGSLPDPTTAGPGSSYTSTTSTIDLSGYRTLPGTDLGGAEFTVSSDLPLRRPGFDNSYPVVDLIESGSTITIDAPLIETTTSGRYIDLRGGAEIPLGPSGYAWQGVVAGSGVEVHQAPGTEVALRTYVKQLDYNFDWHTTAPQVTVSVTIGSPPSSTIAFGTNPAPQLVHYMPMGVFAVPGIDLPSLGPGTRYAKHPAYGVNGGFGITLSGKSSCVLCFEAPVTTTVNNAVLGSSPAPFNRIEMPVPGQVLITLDLGADSTVVFPTVVVTITGLGQMQGVNDMGVNIFDDPQAQYYAEVTLTDVTGAYFDGATIRSGRNAVVFVNSSVMFSDLRDFEEIEFGYNGYKNVVTFPDSYKLKGTMTETYRVYDSGTGTYVTIPEAPESTLLDHSYSELRASDGSRDTANHLIQIADPAELAVRSIFTFGRYGDESDLIGTVNITRDPDTSVEMKLPLPLNIHNTQGFPVVSDAAPPFMVASPVHPINQDTYGHMQVYLDVPAPPMPEDAHVDLTIPAGSQSDVILQVPVPVITVSGEEIYGGSVINVRDGSVLRARRFNNTGNIEITLGAGGAIGNIVGGGGVGRPQVVERPRIVQGRARLTVGLSITVYYAPAQLVGNNDVSVTVPVGAGYAAPLDMTVVSPYWMAVDYSDPTHRPDMRTSDAYLMRKLGAVVKSPENLLDIDANTGNPPQYLAIGVAESGRSGLLPAGHRLVFPASSIITLRPPQDAPRTHDYTLDDLDVFLLPAGTEAVYEVPYSHVDRSVSNRGIPIDAAQNQYATNHPSSLRPVEVATITVNLDDFAMPYHLPGLSSVDVGGNISVVLRDEIMDPILPGGGVYVHATVSVARVKVHTMEKAREIESSVYSNVYQNIWIRIDDEIVVDEGGGLLVTLQPGTVINPVLGTYLPPAGDIAYERSEASRYVLNSPQRVTLAKTASFGRPALLMPAGLRVNTGQRQVRFTNVKGLIAHSPYPIEYGIECGLVDADLGANTIVQSDEGVRATVLQTVEITDSASLPRPDSRAGSGHPCVMLDLSENSDMDRHFIYSSKSLRSADKAVQVRVNDMMRLIGGRLQL